MLPSELAGAQSRASGAAASPGGFPFLDAAYIQSQPPAPLAEFLATPASEVMGKDVAWAGPEDTVQDVIAKMQQQNVGYVLIGVNGDRRFITLLRPPPSPWTHNGKRSPKRKWGLWPFWCDWMPAWMGLAPIGWIMTMRVALAPPVSRIALWHASRYMLRSVSACFTTAWSSSPPSSC